MHAAIRQIGMRTAFELLAAKPKHEQHYKVRPNAVVCRELAHGGVVLRAGLHAEKRMRVPLAEVVEVPKVVAMRTAVHLDGFDYSAQAANERGDSASLVHRKTADDEVVRADVLAEQHTAALPMSGASESSNEELPYLRRNRYPQHLRPRSRRSGARRWWRPHHQSMALEHPHLPGRGTG